MDPLRRGAITKAGRMIAGGLGAAALSGSRGAQVDAAIGLGSLNKYSSQNSGYAGEVPVPDPGWEQRNAVRQKMYRQIEEGERSRRWKVSENAYLEGLKSPSQHWKMQVMLEREKRRQTAIETLREQIEKLYETPMEKLEQFANDALAGFMAEWNKP